MEVCTIFLFRYIYVGYIPSYFGLTGPVQVILATVKGMKKNPRVSAYTLQKAILTTFQDLKLFPAGIYSDIPAVQSWALKYAVAIKKLVLRLFETAWLVPMNLHENVKEKFCL